MKFNQLATLVLALGTASALPQTQDTEFYRPAPSHTVFPLSAPADGRLVSATFEQQREIALKFAMEQLNVATAAAIQTSSRFVNCFN